MPSALKVSAVALALVVPTTAAMAGPFGEWQVTEVTGQPRAEGTTIAFVADGTLAGGAGCNRYFGNFTLDAGLSVSPLGVTRMACPEPAMSDEAAFLEAIGRVTGYAMGVDDGAQVLFLLSNGQILVRARR